MRKQDVKIMMKNILFRAAVEMQANNNEAAAYQLGYLKAVTDLTNITRDEKQKIISEVMDEFYKTCPDTQITATVIFEKYYKLADKKVGA